MQLCIGNSTITPARIFCIGRNYVSHVQELKNSVPDSPVIFQKPATCLVPDGATVSFPDHGDDLHHEAEVVILIGKDGRAKSPDSSREYIEGISLGLDLTLRDVQARLKKAGLPWELAKAFDQSAPVGRFTRLDGGIDLESIEFTCSVNGDLKQQGNTSRMIFPIRRLVAEISRVWQLQRGDLIYTGTPAGVGPLSRGDEVVVASATLGSFSWHID